MTLEDELTGIIEKAVEDLHRGDLFRIPLVAFSDAEDTRYAELKQIVGPWVRTPKEFLPNARSVVSYFVPFTREVAAAPPHDPQNTALWGESYAVINDYFGTINDSLCKFLESKGHEAQAVPATHTYNEADMRSAWSHRSAAAIAGLGYFSANRMLVTAKGSAGRYCTVFTSADLPRRKEAPKNRCPYLRNESCGRCFEACPVGALKPDGLDLFACQAETRRNEKLHIELANLHGADTCGKCIAACPLSYFG